MKTLGRLAWLATLSIGIAGGSSRTLATEYYSLQNPDWPPLPFVPFELSIFDLGNGFLAYDDLAVDYDQVRAGAQLARWLEQTLEGEGPPDPEEGGGEGGEGGGGPPGFDYSTNDLWLEILAVTNSTATVIIHAPDTNAYDLFRTFELTAAPFTNAVWRWVAKGTNGQTLVFPNARCRQALCVLGSGTDTDMDQLTDAFEMLCSKTSPGTNHTYSAELTDLEWWLRSNVLVNDPEQDCGNEQNSQFETTIAVVGTNVIVAWVDSNFGVYALGQDYSLTNYTPRLVGYAVSRNGGVTFEDKGLPPLSRAGAPTNDDGDAGDPVLAVDRASGTVYLIGTSPRNQGFQGIPLWRSADGGVTFTNPIIVREDIVRSDKPWLAVDEAAGTGQHDVYLICNGFLDATTNPPAILLTISTDGGGGTWTNRPIVIRQREGTNINVGAALIQAGHNHEAHAVWAESTAYETGITNWIKTRQVQNRGATLGEVHTVCQLVNTSGSLGLKRSNTAAADDTFRVSPLPVVAVNPATNKPGHLYVAFPDQGNNPGDKADIYFVASTNGGANWTEPVRMNTDSTTNDQWMPVLAVKPDGTQLFMAWYDRRNDANNSLIDVYVSRGTIGTNGNVSFSTEFKISTTNFPPVFAGTLTSNTNNGHYDPVYPPEDVNLHWWYPEWPLTNAFGVPVLTSYTYRSHVGEYNGAWADVNYLYLCWTDYRLQADGTLFPRNQSDIRFVRLSWPQ